MTVSAALTATCFSPSYATARAKFLLAADRAGARVDVLVNQVAAAPDGSTLSTDVAVLGPGQSEAALPGPAQADAALPGPAQADAALPGAAQADAALPGPAQADAALPGPAQADIALPGAAQADAALLVFSGTHGPEGFVGSAAQIALLDSLSAPAEPLPVRVVLVHAINPWDFAHISRTTENNVDLNRNFIDWAKTPPANEAYAELHALLCPADWTPQSLETASAAREAWIARHGVDAFVDATNKGQYSHSDGLNYGGCGREWSNHALETIVARHLSGVKRIGFIDWHTGLGERGEPFFLCFNEPGGPGWQRACSWWGSERVESQDGFGGSKRPKYSGLLFHGVENFAAGAEVTGAVVEFGTGSMDEMRLAVQMDRHLKFGGELPHKQRVEMRERVLDAFSPFSPDWQRSVLGHAIEIQRQALQGVVDWR